ncbi:hypothetical protein [Loktanella sp. M215]|uniref:hypothetical protein n=1 Tax=Loktanella sp. M215 TaxID=2675431 RepID=UPI001F2C2585|nr:hypothetical protein [Loktanella sp. M215]MCF7699365.1 hypothetical protein [Loktanella sp. M215]
MDTVTTLREPLPRRVPLLRSIWRGKLYLSFDDSRDPAIALLTAKRQVRITVCDKRYCATNGGRVPSVATADRAGFMRPIAGCIIRGAHPTVRMKKARCGVPQRA